MNQGADAVNKPFRMALYDHPSFVPPHSDDLLWRYCDMEKFISLLATGRLWFSRADLLGDPLEGSLSQENVRVRPEVYKDVPAHEIAEMTNLRRSMTTHMYVNCWHQNNVESAAMWSQYAGHAGIALVSNLGRIHKAIGKLSDTDETSERAVFAGRVSYVDYGSHYIPESNTFSAFMHKRRSYEHEREVRLLFHFMPRHEAAAEPTVDLSIPTPPGFGVPIDLFELASEVRVSPYAPTWVFEAVRSVASQFGLNVPVLMSDLARDAIY